MLKIKSKNKPRIVVVLGPTASGKSSLGIFLAKKFGGEIISADSRQVYRGMNIGTGKVTKKEQGLAKHHLLDVASPKKVFTVSDFKKLGQKAINDVEHRYKIPLVVGGTGFYIDALVNNSSLPEVPPNKKLRSKLEKKSAEELFKKLRKLDPERAKTIDQKNKRRLIRALEIIEAIGKVPKIVSNIKPEKPSGPRAFTGYQVLWLGLKPKNIEKRIRLRLEARLKQGMVREVINLHKEGISWKRLDDFGLEYRRVSRWLKNHKNNKHTLFSNSQEYENLLRDIIKYSKRQMTWFKRNKEINWINPAVAGQKEAEKLIRKFIYSH